ncbi:unnamed protein product [Arctia plantaginis]|uniref:Uncharacterized protein n=1 Tax=Arctia plantaginis TaxID=874455 RepID=A0A8S0YL90_ARCPL|nr:unnamed protein product [Arctia plantaginis]
MVLYVVIAYILVNHALGAPPLRLTIDCSDERETPFGSLLRSSDYSRRPRVDIDSFCNLIHNAIPKAVENGKFILIDEDLDQDGFSDTQVPMAIAPPTGFIPMLGLKKLKGPRLQVPQLNVPKLHAHAGLHKAPRVGSSINITPLVINEEQSSAENMEKLKKGVQKMLHFVKVLGKIDQYLSERIRIVVDKVSKTFAE